MTREEIHTGLTEVLEDVLELEGLKLKDGLTADDVEGWDSLSHIRIMASLERRFKVKFSNAELDKLKTVGNLIDLIQSKLGD